MLVPTDRPTGITNGDPYDGFVVLAGRFTALAGLRATFRGALDPAVAMWAHVGVGSGCEDNVDNSVDASRGGGDNVLRPATSSYIGQRGHIHGVGSGPEDVVAHHLTMHRRRWRQRPQVHCLLHVCAPASACRSR